MTTNHQLPYLFISPYKVWLYGVIQNWDIDSAGNFATAFPPKKYSSALCTIGDGTSNNHYGAAFGATYNEFLYNDAPTITGSYENRWYHSPEDENTILDLRDFGYGEYSTDTEAGGFLAKNIPKTRQYNQFKMDKIFQVDSTLQPGDDIHFVVDSLNPNSKHEAVFYNNLESAPSGVSLNSNQTSRLPYSLTVFEDDLPSSPTLKVKPYSNDPYLPEYTFTADDDDLWYGFLMFSNTEIKHQYHDALAVIHLNETDVSSTSNIKLRRYDGVHNGTEVEATAIGGTMATSTEGLAGNALLTDASEGCFVTFADNAYTQSTTWGRNEFSVVAHFTCDSIAHAGFIVGKFGEFDLSVDTSGNINAAITPQGGTEVTLKSTSVINTDGETPTNVILTFDRNLISGNVKLFVNGKLEDQSGLRTAAGSANNWKTDTDLANDASARLTIGIEPVDGTTAPSANGFSGKIEEIVLYRKAIYPVVPKTGKFTFTKPIEELSNATIATGISNVARLFIKDYHNIRGTSSTQVAASSNIAYKKAGFGLRTDTG